MIVLIGTLTVEVVVTVLVGVVSSGDDCGDGVQWW